MKRLHQTELRAQINNDHHSLFGKLAVTGGGSVADCRR